MGTNDMRIGGVDRFEAENALDVLMRASVISSDPKMMRAAGEVARARKMELENFSVDDVPRGIHEDATREGKVDF